MKKKYLFIAAGLCLITCAALIISRLGQNKTDDDAPSIKSAGTIIHAEAIEPDTLSLEEAERISELQSHAVEIYMRICSAFGTGSGLTVYPDDFGDAYIDSDNVHLVLCLKDPTQETIDRYKALAGSDAGDYLVIKEVPYSRDELLKIVNEVAAQCIADGLTIYSYGIDVEANGINIGAAEEDAEAVLAMLAKRYPDVPAVIEAGAAFVVDD